MKRPAASGGSLLKLQPLKYSNVSRRIRAGGRVVYFASYGRKYLGCFASEHAAALAAAKAKGMTEAQYGELLAVIGMAHSTNGLVTTMQVPVDDAFQVK